jgi:hypothetical protein
MAAGLKSIVSLTTSVNCITVNNVAVVYVTEYI